MPNLIQATQTEEQSTELDIQRFLPNVPDRFASVLEKLKRFAINDATAKACQIAQLARPEGAPVSGEFVGTIDLSYADQGLAYISITDDKRFPSPLMISIAHHPELNAAKNGDKYGLSLDEFGRVSSIYAQVLETQSTVHNRAGLGDDVF